MKKNKDVYIFDVDGVLFERNQEKTVFDELLIEIKKRLENGCFIGLNTGRSFSFVTEKILVPLEKILNKELLKQIFISCEKGAIDVSYDLNGDKKIKLHKNLTIPREIKEKIENLVKLKKYNPWMFVDQSKEIMLTIEELSNALKNRSIFKNFQEAQASIAKEIQQLIFDNDLSSKIRIDLTRIAIDVESKKSGKAFATRKFIQYLKTKNFIPLKAFCFGDSPSDYEIHQELERNNIESTFIFVGSPKTFIFEKNKNIIFPKKQLTAGVLEFLKKEN